MNSKSVFGWLLATGKNHSKLFSHREMHDFSPFSNFPYIEWKSNSLTWHCLEQYHTRRHPEQRKSASFWQDLHRSLGVLFFSTLSRNLSIYSESRLNLSRKTPFCRGYLWWNVKRCYYIRFYRRNRHYYKYVCRNFKVRQRVCTKYVVRLRCPRKQGDEAEE